MNITEFQKSRFGLFIHWGIYSIPARGEWVRSNEEMKEEDYIPFANEFDPDLFNPHQWAKLAKKAGMKYAVMTAKHHDGYCMFDTKTTDWKANHDYVREFLDAFREEGLKVGLYYCLIGIIRTILTLKIDIIQKETMQNMINQFVFQTI